MYFKLLKMKHVPLFIIFIANYSSVRIWGININIEFNLKIESHFFLQKFYKIFIIIIESNNCINWNYYSSLFMHITLIHIYY